MKNKIKFFINFTRKAIFFDNDFFKSVLNKKLVSLITYLAILIFLLTLVTTTIKVISTTIKYNLTTFPTTLIAGLHQIPSDYTINIVEGRLYTSYDRPLFIYLNHLHLPQSLIVIDEFSTMNADFDHYNSLFLLSQNGIRLRINQNDFFFNYKGLNNIHIDSKVIGSLEYLLKTINFLLPLLLILLIIKLTFIESILILFGRLFYLTIISLILYFIAHEFNKKIIYSHVYKIIIIGTIIPLMFDYILIVFNLTVRLPFWFLIMNSLFGFVAVIEVFFNKKLYPFLK
ncbi:hypothetical protein A3C23_05310 [Candidatus Roizmanbacteria bacterium RIFCSPHIGHO2_02_FULL_37_13b]|uniref:DUF1189 domain-containing protein n=1 Tax=Candidatus Roizmanbacteria bacterium RIFCSPLOWO2_02_FULL_36_11 TaxID=1802071 RepID=A0A1F7JCJ5_9BACT|nr:MAG: hypothetical protein A3C23_05310 [Candidatus Roizmanbacteria bacterium RIFCSPHIGHO2_02_FULL_37_13b]OGK53338.1 MAG: hypothetical protein A3H78_03480 [Candidatus Roizmanbacteria bacterium RIFCSPLOWO2_02_FULL_36_11]